MRTLLLRLTLILSSVVCTLVLAEYILRALPGSSEAFLNRLYEFRSNGVGYYTLRPGRVVQIGTVLYQINGAGFRDRDFSSTPSPGMVRIAALGDSVTFGLGVNLDESLPKALEKTLNSNSVFRHGKQGAEVLNFGVSGLNTIAEIDRFEARARSFHPQHVVLQILLDDFVAPKHSEELNNTGWRSTLKEFLKQYFFALYYRVKKLVLKAKLAQDYSRSTDLVSYIDEVYQREKKDLELTKAALARFHEELARENISLTVILVPYLISPSGDYPLIQFESLWINFFKEKNIEFLNLRELIPNQDLRQLRIDETDPIHFNGTGAQVFAKAIAGNMRLGDIR